MLRFSQAPEQVKGTRWTSAGSCAVMKAQGKLCTVDPNTCRFCVCEFTCLVKFICSLNINTCNTFQPFADMQRVVKSLSHPTLMMPSKVKQGVTSCLSLPHAEMPKGWRRRAMQCCARRPDSGNIGWDLKLSSGPCSWDNFRSPNTFAPYFLFF